MEIPVNRQIVECQLAAHFCDVRTAQRNPTRRLYDQRHWIADLFFEKNHENPHRFSDWWSRRQAAVFRLAKRFEEMDNANLELEFGDESNGDTFWGTDANSGADGKLNYTKFLTPS